MPGTYTDYVIQEKKKTLHERKALNTMTDRLNNNVPSIIIADRGYESFNVFAHCTKKKWFLIHIKDNKKNGIFTAYNLPGGEFDYVINNIPAKPLTKETVLLLEK